MIWFIVSRHIAIFRFSKWPPPPSWIFEIGKFYQLTGSRVSRRISLPNIVKICQSVANILRFFNFSKLWPPPPWLFKFVKFHWQTMSRRPILIIVLNIVKIGGFVAIILRFFRPILDFLATRVDRVETPNLRLSVVLTAMDQKLPKS